MAHLGAAFALLGYIFWVLQLINRSDAELLQSRRVRELKLFRMSTILLSFVALQILLGALVAGIDAGRNYTDWPLMAGAFLPPDFFGFNSDLNLQYRGRLSNKRENPAELRRDLFLAMMEIANSGKGPLDQIPSMGCSIKWKS